ncbi:hypothetical protein EPA93_32925 [Ktedonosporobacter rubrisoli]|uniref:Uncharacterized protein n=1 Tax=Ktedonosporobacter rubrisoli TaxID=2509675 RepID=A0A4P6JXN3_KTERU|nr:hypothetical protein [Ktedonosporobacter rubrisoli]QBD80519.1 hypothetical protein EPA93_32925 [Ktedonosporobacter rubrisoli]
MAPELEQRLQNMMKEQLIELVGQLVAQHPSLEAAILQAVENVLAINEIGNEVTEDWDFSRSAIDEAQTSSQLEQKLSPRDLDAYRQRLAGYAARLQQEPALALRNDLLEIVDEAKERSDAHDYHNALSLCALIFDQRLTEQELVLTKLFDTAIDAIMLFLEALLNEASSNLILDSSSTLTPLLTPTLRRRWLERLFQLWLQRLDASYADERIPEVILEVAWDEDVDFLQNLVQDELARQHTGMHSNIVDFTRQYRSKTLERFMKDLSSI